MDMRLILSAAAALTAAPLTATSAPLEPLGMTFAPRSPAPVAADHPLFRSIAFEAVEGMPRRVGPFYGPFANAKEMNNAMRRSLEAVNLLAPSGTPAKATLKVRWVGLDAPMRISSSSEATATLGYTLTAADGRQLLQRDIRTYATAEGGVASERLRGTARLALATNIASALVCMDQVGRGNEPSDCTLRPTKSFQAPAPVILVPM